MANRTPTRPGTTGARKPPSALASARVVTVPRFGLPRSANDNRQTPRRWLQRNAGRLLYWGFALGIAALAVAALI